MVAQSYRVAHEVIEKQLVDQHRLSLGCVVADARQGRETARAIAPGIGINTCRLA